MRYIKLTGKKPINDPRNLLKFEPDVTYQIEDWMDTYNIDRLIRFRYLSEIEDPVGEIYSVDNELREARDSKSKNTRYTTLDGRLEAMEDRLKYCTQYLQKIWEMPNDRIDRGLLIEQFVRTWYGRGQLTTEIPNEGNLGTTTFSHEFAAGTKDISVVDASAFSVGSVLAVQYANGTHGTHFVNAKNVNALTIYPQLQYGVNGTCTVERAWYNSSQAGPSALSYIAEQIANANYDEYGYDTRLFSLDFETVNYSALNSATVAPSNPNSLPSSDYGTALNSFSGKNGYMIAAGVGQGLRSNDFAVTAGSKVICRGWCKTNSANSAVVRLVTSSGTILAEAPIPQTYVHKKITFSLFIPPMVSSVHLEFVQTGPNITLYMDEWEVVSPLNVGYIVPRDAKIVMLFDDWGLSQSEKIKTRLGELLPSATIINKSISGNTATNMINRFDTDVAPYKPTVVLINAGINDVYGSSTDPNTYKNNLIALKNKCNSINALPVFLGIPALAESDPRTGHTAFALTDKARSWAKVARDNI